MIKQESLLLSNHMALYDILIKKDNILRKIKELVDFSFVDDMLVQYYRVDFGRPGYSPQQMFKYLLLKDMYELSDEDLVKRAYVDMSFKYFLDLAPEDNVIDSSTLTKFRKLRLKDENILDTLIGKTVKIAIDNGIKLSGNIIVDSTHTNARYKNKTPREYLLEQAKLLRKSVYEADESYKERMPKKLDTHKIGIYENVCEYAQEIVDLIKKDEKLILREAISTKLNLVQEIIDDVNEELSYSKDEDAKIGHKTADTSYFGYKSHIAMTTDRIITAVSITSGEKPDGKELQKLIEKTEEYIGVEAVIGDGAYSEKENIEYANEKDIKLVSKLSNTVIKGNKKIPLEFTYNKDAKRYVCPNGHMAYKTSMMGKKRHEIEGAPLREVHFFDVEKCRVCPLKEKCKFKEGQKAKTYTVTIKKDQIHEEHLNKNETEEYRRLAKERYKIEAKNGELKNNHGYTNCVYSGLFGMQLQSAISVFNVNIKRILKLKEEVLYQNKDQ